MFFEELKNYDSEVYAYCEEELSRQRNNIELIASENIVSKAVLLAAGGVLTNKYAEGYPAKRYYAVVSTLTVLKKLQEKEQRKSSVQSMQTFSRTAEQTQTLPPFLPCLLPATQFFQ